MALQTMIIIGEIIAFDIGDEDVLFHVRDEYGVYHQCIGDALGYGPAIRLLTKNNDRVEVTGEIERRELYHTHGVRQDILVISYLKQLMPAHEDFNFRLTGALY